MTGHNGLRVGDRVCELGPWQDDERWGAIEATDAAGLAVRWEDTPDALDAYDPTQAAYWHVERGQR